MPALPLADLRDAPTGAPNCWQCRYFSISWDTSRPYSCRLMGFKSKALPSIEVLRADGQPCRGFVAKMPVATAAAPAAMAQASAKPSSRVWEA
jgi:hypothetical protein